MQHSQLSQILMESVELESHLDQNLRATNLSRYNQTSQKVNPLVDLDTIQRIESPKGQGQGHQQIDSPSLEQVLIKANQRSVSVISPKLIHTTNQSGVEVTSLNLQNEESIFHSGIQSPDLQVDKQNRMTIKVSVDTHNNTQSELENFGENTKSTREDATRSQMSNYEKTGKKLYQISELIIDGPKLNQQSSSNHKLAAPYKTSKKLRNQVKFITEVNQPKIDLRKSPDQQIKEHIVRKIREESLKRKIVRVSPAQLNYLQKVDGQKKDFKQSTVSKREVIDLKIQAVNPDPYSQRVSTLVSPTQIDKKRKLKPGSDSNPDLNVVDSNAINNWDKNYANLASPTMMDLIEAEPNLKGFTSPVRGATPANTDDPSPTQSRYQNKYANQNINVVHKHQSTQEFDVKEHKKTKDLTDLTIKRDSILSITTQQDNNVFVSMQAKLYVKLEDGEKSPHVKSDRESLHETTTNHSKHLQPVQPMKAEIATSPYSKFLSPDTTQKEQIESRLNKYQQKQQSYVNLNALQEFQQEMIQDQTSRIILPIKSVSSLNKISSRNQFQVQTKRHQSVDRSATHQNNYQYQQNFYNKLAERFKAKSFQAPFSPRERSNILQDLMNQPELVIQEWMKIQQAVTPQNEVQESDHLVHQLILPSLKTKDISPSFSNSVGKTIKELTQKKAQQKLTQQAQQSPKKYDAVEVLKEVSTRQEYVTSKIKHEYTKRQLDAQGNWRIQVGRKLDTDRQMILKDYSKSKFFRNPLQLPQQVEEGLHHLPNAKEILELEITHRQKPSELPAILIPQQLEPEIGKVKIGQSLLTKKKKKTKNTHHIPTSQEITTLLAPPALNVNTQQSQAKEVEHEYNSENLESPQSPPRSPIRQQNYQQNVINQTSFFSVTISQKETSELEPKKAQLKAKFQKLNLQKPINETTTVQSLTRYSQALISQHDSQKDGIAVLVTDQNF